MNEKKYKYKREHFDTQEQYDRFKSNRSRWQLTWLRKHEEADPEYKERRLLRQRLYSRYYWRSDGRETFADWLSKTCAIEDIITIPIERLREVAAMIPGPYGKAKKKLEQQPF